MTRAGLISCGILLRDHYERSEPPGQETRIANTSPTVTDQSVHTHSKNTATAHRHSDRKPSWEDALWQRYWLKLVLQVLPFHVLAPFGGCTRPVRELGGLGEYATQSLLISPRTWILVVRDTLAVVLCEQWVQ